MRWASDEVMASPVPRKKIHPHYPRKAELALAILRIRSLRSGLIGGVPTKYSSVSKVLDFFAVWSHGGSWWKCISGSHSERSYLRFARDGIWCLIKRIYKSGFCKNRSLNTAKNVSSFQPEKKHHFPWTLKEKESWSTDQEPSVWLWQLVSQNICPYPWGWRVHRILRICGDVSGRPCCQELCNGNH